MADTKPVHVVEWLRSEAGRAAIVQKFARDITSYHMVKIAERFPVVMHMHDENIALVREDEAEDAMAWMIEVMRTPPETRDG